MTHPYQHTASRSPHNSILYSMLVNQRQDRSLHSIGTLSHRERVVRSSVANTFRQSRPRSSCSDLRAEHGLRMGLCDNKNSTTSSMDRLSSDNHRHTVCMRGLNHGVPGPILHSNSKMALPSYPVQDQPIDFTIERPKYGSQVTFTTDQCSKSTTFAQVHHIPSSHVSDHEVPLDLSMKKVTDAKRSTEYSVLRNILSGSRAHETARTHTSTSQTKTEKCIQKVTLAKKNMLPVCSRVSDWIVKIVQFAKSLPGFASLARNDQVDLILNSWARLLILEMAENNFHFVVTPVNETHAHPNSPAAPTVGSVNKLQGFIQKCQQLKVDRQEYFYLSASVLYNTDIRHLEAQSQIALAGKVALESLRQYISAAQPSHSVRYSKLLLCLPALYSIDCKMVESLFCRLITEKTDMELLLKDLLQNLSPVFNS